MQLSSARAGGQVPDALDLSLYRPRQCMDEVTAGARFGLLKATSLSESLGHDMAVLAEVFTHIAPTRTFSIADAVPELATEILKRAAKPPAELERP